MRYDMKVRVHARHLASDIYHLSLGLGLFVLGACSDWRDGIPKDSPASQQQVLAFSASVAPSKAVTRADGSLINRTETSLFRTAPRSHWVLDENGQLTETQVQYSVGIFSTYQHDSLWTDYVGNVVLKQPTANFMFNQKMDISAPDDYGHNQLTYASAAGSSHGQDSVRFWPNHRNDVGAFDHKLSFWAYYPYNPTEDPGIYGSSITPVEKKTGSKTYGVTAGSGMGSVRFVMHPDASEQSDFMVSDLVADCTREQFPLNGATPTPVPLHFHHLLAQVRIYAWVTGSDRIVYLKGSDETDLTVTSISGSLVALSDGSSYSAPTAKPTYFDAWGKETELKTGDRVPDDTYWLKNASPKSKRWNRVIEETQFEGSLYSKGEKVTGIDNHYRAQNTLSLSFNNIHTECVYTPHVTYNSTSKTYTTSLTKRGDDYQDVGTLGSATVNHYIQNPYWFYFDKDNNRVMLNPRYMYDYFEETPAYKGELEEETGSNYEKDWSTFSKGTSENKSRNYLNYHLTHENLVPDDYRKPAAAGNNDWHYNFASGNVLLCVPQVMNDNDVPHIVITATGKQVSYVWDSGSGKYIQEFVTDSEGSSTISGRVTINMLNMNLRWEPGFIYCYAFLDDLQPDDDKVRGPESIVVVFDPTKQTDQW